jgi:magnesium-dependent phosphatase 1
MIKKKKKKMVFFDDEVRNRNVETLGVVMLLVENGVSALEVDKGVREWRRRKGKEKEVKRQMEEVQ